jgi:hypothetical protein
LHSCRRQGYPAAVERFAGGDRKLLFEREDTLMSGVADSKQSDQVDAGLDAIEQAFDRWNELTIHHQKKQKRFGFFTALLGPVAVLLLTVQIVTFAQNRPVSVTLIALELGALVIALSFGFFNSGSPNTWMKYRLRAELLRREKFLVLARVGPYLKGDTPRNVIDSRLVLIDSDATDPAGLILLQDADGRTWSEALEDARAAKVQTASPDPDALETFRDRRLLNQRDWYSRRSSEWGGRDDLFENIAKFVLISAVVLSALHLATLYLGDESIEKQILEILAIVLPPVGAAATALQSLFEGRRLSRSYEDRALTLTNLAAALACIKPPLAAGGTDEFQFKRLVLRTENALASELHQWWLLRHTHTPGV